MTLDEIREIASSLGIQSVHKFDQKDDLIRTIQLAEGHSDCFRRIPGCANEKCAWIDDCIGKK